MKLMPPPRWSLLALVLGTFVLAVPSPARAATTLYAANVTDTTGSCSAAVPCRIDHAIVLASAGDTVQVAPGTYDVTYAIQVAKAIVVAGAPGQPRPVLAGNASLTSNTVAASAGATIRHLSIQATNSTGEQTAALSVAGATAEDLELFASSADSQGAALDVKTDPNGTIARTILARSQAPNGEAVSFKDGTTPGTATVYNVTAIGGSSTTPAFNGNVAAGTATIRNSIASGATTDITIKGGTQNLRVANSSLRTSASTGVTNLGGNVGAALFADAAHANYREGASSPTIDAGVADAALSTTDLDGGARTQGSAVDMGAFEQVPAGGSGTTAGGGTTATATGDAPAATSAAVATPRANPAAPGAGTEQLTLPAPTPPVLGQSMTVQPASGAVTVKLPGKQTFVPLPAGAQVPVGADVDATRGAVQLTSAVDTNGRTQTGTFSGGRFVVRQHEGANPTTDLVLQGGSFAGCGRGPARAAAHAPLAFAAKRGSRGKRVVRSLWGRDHGGRFRSIGSKAVATVRGTVWHTVDRCDGTLVEVRQGAVSVASRKTGRAVLVHAGGRRLVTR